MIAQIKKYRPSLVVSDADVVGEAPDFPYVEYDQYMDPISETFEAMENDPVTIGIQLKALSNVKNEAKEIAYWMSKLYREQQPAYELEQNGIVIQEATMLPPTTDDLTAGFIFTSGVDLRVEIIDGFTDDTQPGQIGSVDVLMTKDTKEE
nr:hypothetical protein [Lactiplantibacillus daowaiensis]